jgi:hypothetical protein
MALRLIMHKYLLCKGDLRVDVMDFWISFCPYLDGLGSLAYSRSQLINSDILNLTDSL